jgi:hypothetical protein
MSLAVRTGLSRMPLLSVISCAILAGSKLTAEYGDNVVEGIKAAHAS